MEIDFKNHLLINSPESNQSNQNNKKIDLVLDSKHLLILNEIYDSAQNKVIIKNKHQLILAKQFVKTHPFNAYNTLELKKYNTYHATKKTQLSFVLVMSFFSGFGALYSLAKNFRLKFVLSFNSLCWSFFLIYYIKKGRFGIYEDFFNKEMKDFLFKKYYDEVYLKHSNNNNL